MAETEKKSPLEIEGEKYRQELLAKNTFNEKNQEPIDEAGAMKDPNGIGEIGTKSDQQARQGALKFNKFNEKNKYPNW